MRIKIYFSNPDGKTYLPINTNYYLVRLIEYLTFEYRRYLNSLVSYDNRQRQFNMYTFSQLIIPERKITDYKLGILSKEFYWYIASPFYQFLGIIARELRNRKVVKIYNKWFPVTQVRFICSPSFESSEARFTCLSPIAVYRQDFNDRPAHSYQFNGGYILPDQKEYLEYIEKDLLTKYRILQGKPKKDIKMDLQFDQNYIVRRNNKITKVIALENGNSFKEYIRGVLAPLQIKAEPEILQLIYDSGLGQLNNLGFGMLETISQT